MAIVNGLIPIKNPWLLSSIICLFSSQMALLCMSSCMKSQNTSRKTQVNQRTCAIRALVLVFKSLESVSPVHRRLRHGCSSRSPTQSGPPHLSLMLRATGRTAGERAELLSAGSWPDELQGHEHPSVIVSTQEICCYHAFCLLFVSLPRLNMLCTF